MVQTITSDLDKKLELRPINTSTERRWHSQVTNTALPFAQQFHINKSHALRRQDLISIASGSSITSIQTADSRCKVKSSKLASPSSSDMFKLPSTSELTAPRNTRTTSALRMRSTATITQPKTGVRILHSRPRENLLRIFLPNSRRIITSSFSRHRLILHTLERLKIFQNSILEI